MALWPNNRRDLPGMFPMLHAGALAFAETAQRTQRNVAYFANAEIEETSSIPEGAFQGRACLVAPLVGGGMASANSAADITLAASGNALNGGPVSGATTITTTADGVNLSLVVGLSGTAAATMTCDGITLALTIGLGGAASWTLTADGASLGLIVPFGGTATITMSGAADLKGLLSLSGESTPFTELSPQNLAAAVWASVAADHDDPGTMGEKLNDAGSAANPWTEVIESGFTAAEIMRLLAAVMAGKSSGGGTATVKFRDLADTKDRVTATVDTNGNRTAVVRDVS